MRVFGIIVMLAVTVSCMAGNVKIISPNLYVSPGGNDNNPGTIDKPFATLGRARDAVREFKRGVSKPITVLFREGTYYLSGPVVFGAEDSGTDLQPITYAAYGDEKPVISGGVKLDVKWKPYRGGIMKCPVPKGMDFNQLFIDGKRRMRARYPNFDPDKPLVGEGGYLNTAGASGGDALNPFDVIGKKSVDKKKDRGQYFFWDPDTFTKKKWANPTDAIVHIFPGSYWNNFQFRVKSIDWDRKHVVLGEGGWQTCLLDNPDDFFGTALTTGSHYFIDNGFEELDAAGEWYLDKKESVLYYMPHENTDIKNAVVEVGLLKRLIEVKGSREKPVRCINFEGIRFTNTSATFLDEYIDPSTGDWGIHRGGTVYFEGAEDCSVKECFFDAVGGNAVYISDYARRIKVYGNTFSHTGDSAVCLVGKSHVIENGKMPCPICGVESYWSFGDEPKDFPAYCDISNNHIHHIGQYGKQTAGVFMAMTLKNTVRHNYIHDMPRAAICINDPFFGGHIIEYNLMRDNVQETNDHGTFNAWGRGHWWCVGVQHARIYHHPGDVHEDAKFTTHIRYNHIRERVSEKHQLAYGSTNMGITMDDGSANFHVYKNLVIGGSVQNRNGSYRVVENNIFINPHRGPGYHVSHTYSGDKFVRNIVTKENSKTFFWIALQNDSEPWIDEMDYNVYYGAGPLSDSAADLEQWQQQGFDKHSVNADPMFVDPANGDYRVKPGSPAIKLGFENFDVSRCGLLPNFTEKWNK